MFSNKNNDKYKFNKDFKKASANASPASSIYEIAKRIFDERDEIWLRANKLAKGDANSQAVIFTFLIRAAFQAQDLSMTQAAEDKFAMNDFFSTGRFSVAWKIYNKIKLVEKEARAAKKENEETISPEIQLDEEYEAKQARQLARQRAEMGVGLRTQLNAKGLEGGELRQHLLKILRTNHVDKNQEGNAGLAQAATDVLNLIKDGKFEIYEQELNARRQLRR